MLLLDDQVKLPNGPLLRENVVLSFWQTKDEEPMIEATQLFADEPLDELIELIMVVLVLSGSR